jgi:hypothetical protein
MKLEMEYNPRGGVKTATKAEYRRRGYKIKNEAD